MITRWDVTREGFPNLTLAEFIGLYIRANGGDRNQIVTRIKFEYFDEYVAVCCAATPAECDAPDGCTACGEFGTRRRPA
jgi:hypothetical protein